MTTSAAPSFRHHPRRHRRSAIVVAAVVLATTGGQAATATPAGAQARLVNALVHTFPELPRPGDDVTVAVDVTGCVPGPVTVELIMTTDDGETRTSTMFERGAAVTNLLRRTRAVLSLPDALRGWYGARVLCGNFRPPEVAMANTLFAVGIDVAAPMAVSVPSAEAGATVGLSGSACPGTVVEYDLSAAARWSGAFEADGTIAVGPDGAWAGDASVPIDLPPGPARIRARCVVSGRAAEDVYVYYDDLQGSTGQQGSADQQGLSIVGGTE